MSKEGNMEELERGQENRDNRIAQLRAENVVLFGRVSELESQLSDVEEREARLKAQIKEARKLAAEASAARIRADRNADARWRERIQGEINDRERRIGQALGADGDHSMAGRHQEVVRALRSLLDSGEESNEECPDCGREMPADFFVRECSCSPAFHREGREQFCPEKTQKNWTTDGGSASAVTTSSGPNPKDEEDENARVALVRLRDNLAQKARVAESMRDRWTEDKEFAVEVVESFVKDCRILGAATYPIPDAGGVPKEDPSGLSPDRDNEGGEDATVAEVVITAGRLVDAVRNWRDSDGFPAYGLAPAFEACEEAISNLSQEADNG